jgi:RNA polymerase sigma factor (sigma-70 family)
LPRRLFFRAYEELDHLKEPGKFAGWLRSIATNFCRMWKRGRDERTKSLDAPWHHALVEELPTAEDQPEEVLESRKRQVALEKILGLLSDKVRLTATLFYIDDLSYREISTFLDVPVSTVKIRLHKARNKLREVLYES